MDIDISGNISGILGTATTDADYTGKKICELPDMVIDSAQELKERFDAAVIDVLDPKYRENVSQVAQTLSSLVSQTKTALRGKSDVGHSHDARDVAGTLAIESGGTGNTTPAGMRMSFDIYSKSETRGQINSAITQHDTYSTAHSNLFSAVSDRISVIEEELNGLESALGAI